MRFCGGFSHLQELGRTKERPQADGVAGERVHSALLAVDDADRRSALQTGLAQRLDGLDGGAAGGDDVLDQADLLARLEDALEPLAGSVALLLLADDQERQAGRERRRRS